MKVNKTLCLRAQSKKLIQPTLGPLYLQPPFGKLTVITYQSMIEIPH